MFEADFEYWLNQDIKDVPEMNSFTEMLERLRNFRNEDIEQEYADITQRDVEFDPEGELSNLNRPTLRFDLTGGSNLVNQLRNDAEALKYDENGAVMHSYNVGRGIIRGIESALQSLDNFDLDDEPVLEIQDGLEPVNPICDEDLGTEAVKQVKEYVQGMNYDASKPMATGLLAAYAENK